MYAQTAAYFIQAYCVVNFKDPACMESIVAEGGIIDARENAITMVEA